MPIILVRQSKNHSTGIGIILILTPIGSFSEPQHSWPIGANGIFNPRIPDSNPECLDSAALTPLKRHTDHCWG